MCMPNTSTGNKGTGASVIYMSVMPGTQRAQEIQHIAIVDCSQAQFLHAPAKAKDALLLLSFTCSV